MARSVLLLCLLGALVGCSTAARSGERSPLVRAPRVAPTQPRDARAPERCALTCPAPVLPTAGPLRYRMLLQSSENATMAGTPNATAAGAGSNATAGASASPAPEASAASSPAPGGGARRCVCKGILIALVAPAQDVLLQRAGRGRCDARDRW